LWRPLELFVSKVRNSDHAHVLAKEIIELLLPGLLKEEHFSLMPLGHWTKIDFDLQTVYMVVYMTLNEKFRHLYKGFETWDRKSMDDLPQLVLRTADKDRYEEFQDLVKRSLEVKAVRKDRLKDSPLKVLQFLLKTRVRRPGWTFRFDDPRSK
jgi:hypothetical protein